MPKVNLDGIEYESAQEVINALKKAQGATADLQVKLDGKSKEIETIRADRDTLKAESETLKKRDIGSEIASGVKSRLDLERNAGICLDGEDVSALTDAEIRAKVIAKQFPEIKLDGKTPEYVNACFDNAVVLMNKEAERAGIRSQRVQSTQTTHSDGDNEPDPEKARNSYVERLKKAYKNDERYNKTDCSTNKK
jgi:hypothetical protein